jgi:hypothetical protein
VDSILQTGYRVSSPGCPESFLRVEERPRCRRRQWREHLSQRTRLEVVEQQRLQPLDLQGFAKDHCGVTEDAMRKNSQSLNAAPLHSLSSSLYYTHFWFPLKKSIMRLAHTFYKNPITYFDNIAIEQRGDKGSSRF